MTTPQKTTATKKVLFICTGNSARSQMAEAVLRHQSAGLYEAFSAGTKPEPIDERALNALLQYGIDTHNLSSKAIDEIIDITFDYVITLCDKARQECISLPSANEIIAWDVIDPRTRTGKDPFQATLMEISDRIKMFLLVKKPNKK